MYQAVSAFCLFFVLCWVVLCCECAHNVLYVHARVAWCKSFARAHSVYACLCCFSSFWFRLQKEYERKVFQLKRYIVRNVIVIDWYACLCLQGDCQQVYSLHTYAKLYAYKVITFIGQQVLLLRHYFVLVSWDCTYLRIESNACWVHAVLSAQLLRLS